MSDSPSKKDTTRRNIVLALSAAVGASSVKIIESGLGKLIPDFVEAPLRNLFDHVAPSQAELDAAGLLFFRGIDGLDVIPSARPSKEDSKVLEVTDPTKFALKASETILARTGTKIVPVDQIERTALVRNALLLGGPVANPFVREIMGDNGFSPNFCDLRTQQSIYFPYHFDLRENSLGAYRTEGLRKMATPDWLLYNGTNALAPINVDENGRPIEDHVLITSIPNIYNAAAQLNGDRITIFAGRHGVATRSLALFAGASTIVNSLNESTKPGRGWQAIIRIDQVDRSGTIPLSLNQRFSFHQLDIDFDFVRPRHAHHHRRE